MPRDATATRQRLLDAAFAEFARYGLAGGRVDRIAAAAKANKQLIYAYFGSKEGLFDAVMTRRLGIVVDAVPVDADDLPGYAAALAHLLAREPQLQRLALWRRLEQPEVVEAEVASYQHKLEAVGRARPTRGPLASLETADLLALVLAVATSAALPPVLAAYAADPPDSAARRTAYAEAVRAAVSALLRAD